MSPMADKAQVPAPTAARAMASVDEEEGKSSPEMAQLVTMMAALTKRLDGMEKAATAVTPKTAPMTPSELGGQVYGASMFRAARTPSPMHLDSFGDVDADRWAPMSASGIFA